ncbi:MAG: transglycosylase SLT domain-containing protein [Paludibacteraceae bacterium]|nr:transglycosylase SLT domain-containing protein [Paludibacteraceae bacterium]
MMSNFTRHIGNAVLWAATTLLVSCGGAATEQVEQTEPADTSVITIGTLSQSISYYEKSDKIMGYEYELAEDFAKSQNKQARYVLGKDVNDLVEKVRNGEIDIVAYPIVMSNENRQQILFTDNTYITHQVLVQRKDVSATAKKPTKKGKKGKKVSEQPAPKSNMVTDVTQLIGKEVWVLKGSKHEERLLHLNEEIGGGIVIKTCGNEKDEEDLIDEVSKKEIDFTICDEKMAKANSTEYTNIDLGTNVSFDQRAAWAAKDTTLQKMVNSWVLQKQTQKLVQTLQMKYFATHHLVTVHHKVRITKIPKGSHLISNYDPYFRQYAKDNGFDWRLAAAVAHKESRFTPHVVGWSGSIGLMQLMPNTAKNFGAKSSEDLFDPEINVKVGCRCLKNYIDCFKSIADMDTRVKFALASYNAGLGHIKDAQALAKKYGKDPQKWEDNVEPFVRLKSNRQYYTDPVVKHGYASGHNIVNYVATIMAQFNEYKAKVSEKGDKVKEEPIKEIADEQLELPE